MKDVPIGHELRKLGMAVAGKELDTVGSHSEQG